jgi:hypothetical protein
MGVQHFASNATQNHDQQRGEQEGYAANLFVHR